MDKKKPSSKPSSKPGSAKNPSSKGKSMKKSKKSNDPYISKYPPINYNLDIPFTTLEIKMEVGKSCIREKVPISTTFNRLIEMISKHHANACHNIRLYVIENSQRKYLDDLRFYTLKDFDVKSDQIYQLFYDFEPIVHPMLEAGSV
jgi:hypothetical protein